VKSYLHDRDFLLVLDNVEHLLPAAPVAAAWLSTCPRLTILTTSRAVLRLTGEHDVTVAALEVPDLDRLPPVDRLAEIPAVRWFVERAGAARTAFAPTEDDLRAIAAICVRLDGLPLAIELAAARVPHLAPPALLSRLERRLTLLTGGPRDQPDRLRAMRNAIAWSDDLLAPDQQALFRRLAVFIGGFTLDAAAAVAGGDVLDGDVLDSVAALVDNSLLRQETHSATGGDPEPRYAMLETVREFALEQLEASGEAEVSRRMHAAYFLDLAERADPAIWGGPEHKRWLDRLETELANLRAALVWLESVDDRAGFLRLAAALGGLWYFRSYRVEGRDWLRKAVASDDGAVPAARATALVKLALLDRELDGVLTPALVEEAIELRRALGLEQMVGHNLMLLASMLDPRTDADRIAQAAAEATAIVTRLDDAGGLAVVRARDGEAALERDDADRAHALMTEALALSRRDGVPFHVSSTLLELGGVEADRGEIAAAAGRYAECMRLWDETGSQECIVAAVAGMGRLAAAAGRPEAAARLLGAAAALGAALGYTPPPLERARSERAVATSCTALGEKWFAASQAAGAALPFDAARAEAETLLATLAECPEPRDSRAPAAPGGLTPREMEVLRLVAAGRSNREIADALSISIPTVKRHLTTILAKLDLPSRAAAVAYAHNHGLA
jgi:non-specific serine/threonine protein kinase